MFDVRFGIKAVEPVMIKNEAGVWINLQYMKFMWSSQGEINAERFLVLIQMVGHSKKQAVVLQSGFESKEQADKYIDELLDTLHSMNRGRS